VSTQAAACDVVDGWVQSCGYVLEVGEVGKVGVVDGLADTGGLSCQSLGRPFNFAWELQTFGDQEICSQDMPQRRPGSTADLTHL
jgi:hypothetical protein